MTTDTDGILESVRRHLQQHAREAGYYALLLALLEWLEDEIARAQGHGGGGDEGREQRE